MSWKLVVDRESIATLCELPSAKKRKNRNRRPMQKGRPHYLSMLRKKKSSRTRKASHSGLKDAFHEKRKGDASTGARRKGRNARRGEGNYMSNRLPDHRSAGRRGKKSPAPCRRGSSFSFRGEGDEP